MRQNHRNRVHTKVRELASNQEEADTKLLLHTSYMLIDNNPDHKSVIQSPSGDVDINILFITVFHNHRDIIWIDYGTGAHRHIINLKSVDMDSDKKLALIGFHAVTGNDYVSSFFQLNTLKRKCFYSLRKQIYSSKSVDRTVISISA